MGGIVVPVMHMQTMVASGLPSCLALVPWCHNGVVSVCVLEKCMVFFSCGTPGGQTKLEDSICLAPTIEMTSWIPRRKRTEYDILDNEMGTGLVSYIAYSKRGLARVIVHDRWSRHTKNPIRRAQKVIWTDQYDQRLLLEM